LNTANLDIRWLALGFLRSPNMMAAAVQKLNEQDFSQHEVPLKLAFVLGKKWHLSSRAPMPYEVLLSAFENDFLVPRAVSERDALAFGELVDWVYFRFSSSIAEVEQHLLDNLSRFIVDRKIRPRLGGLQDSPDLLGQLADIGREVAKAGIGKARFIDPFGDESPLLSALKRTPWGVDFIDRVTSGGSTPGETALFLAPSGGGKTLTNVQLAATTALLRRKAMIISYEQGATPGITNRIYACAMGRSVDAFQGMGPADFAKRKDLQQQYEEVRSKLKGMVMIVDQLQAARDHAGGSGGAAEIGSIIKQAMDSGFEPEYIGIDWLGPMVNNYMAARNVPDSETTKVMSRTADDLRKIGDDLKVNAFLFHQLGTEASAKGPRNKPQATDAFQCRTLHHYMDTVICVGNRDKESQLAWINAPKVRNGEPFRDMLIQMDGAHSVWRTVDERNINMETMKMESSGPRQDRGEVPWFDDMVRSTMG